MEKWKTDLYESNFVDARNDLEAGSRHLDEEEKVQRNDADLKKKCFTSNNKKYFSFLNVRRWGLKVN